MISRRWRCNKWANRTRSLLPRRQKPPSLTFRLRHAFPRTTTCSVSVLYKWDKMISRRPSHFKPFHGGPMGSIDLNTQLTPQLKMLRTRALQGRRTTATHQYRRILRLVHYRLNRHIFARSWLKFVVARKAKRLPLLPWTSDLDFSRKPSCRSA